MIDGRERPGLWSGQGVHFVSLAVLLALVAIAWRSLGQPCATIFWIAVAVPVAHQLFVWLAWRCEIQSGGTSRAIGFRGYLGCFFLLFFGRFVSLAALAWADRGSLGLPDGLRWLVTGILLLPGLYAAYSVARYFGMARAAGADHFDPQVAGMPPVDAGIFRFTNNGMYIYAFLLFWAIAVGFNSAAALVVAAFSHAYIWVHFYTVEKPDSDYLHADRMPITN